MTQTFIVYEFIEMWSFLKTNTFSLLSMILFLLLFCYFLVY